VLATSTVRALHVGKTPIAAATAVMLLLPATWSLVLVLVLLLLFMRLQSAKDTRVQINLRAQSAAIWFSEGSFLDLKNFGFFIYFFLGCGYFA
jgi:hypothetical protein